MDGGAALALSVDDGAALAFPLDDGATLTLSVPDRAALPWSADDGSALTCSVDEGATLTGSTYGGTAEALSSTLSPRVRFSTADSCDIDSLAPTTVETPMIFAWTTALSDKDCALLLQVSAGVAHDSTGTAIGGSVDPESGSAVHNVFVIGSGGPLVASTAGISILPGSLSSTGLRSHTLGDDSPWLSDADILEERSFERDGLSTCLYPKAASAFADAACLMCNACGSVVDSPDGGASGDFGAAFPGDRTPRNAANLPGLAPELADGEVSVPETWVGFGTALGCMSNGCASRPTGSAGMELEWEYRSGAGADADADDGFPLVEPRFCTPVGRSPCDCVHDSLDAPTGAPPEPSATLRPTAASPLTEGSCWLPDGEADVATALGGIAVGALGAALVGDRSPRKPANRPVLTSDPDEGDAPLPRFCAASDLPAGTRVVTLWAGERALDLGGHSATEVDPELRLTSPVAWSIGVGPTRIDPGSSLLSVVLVVPGPRFCLTAECSPCVCGTDNLDERASATAGPSAKLQPPVSSFLDDCL